jgi:catechol 2,3-dioxygenase-like lactoylglutathione lyase family enzyme
MIEYVDHVNLVVEDLAAMTAFYRDALGLRVTREVTIRGDWIQAITGLANVEADVVYLEAERGPPVELIAYRTPEGPARPAGLGEPNLPGLRHVAFRTGGLDATVASLRAAGAELLSEVREVPAAQVEFGGRRKRIVYFRDPEGNLLELCAYE